MNVGVKQAGTCWNGSTGTFSVTKLEEMPWIGEINSYEDRAKKRADKEKMKQLEKYNVYAVPCRDSEGKPTIMWLLEDPKSGKKVNNPELLEFLNMKGAKLDPKMFQILTLDGFEEKVASSWRDGVEYFSGKEYTGLKKIGLQGLQGLQDFSESDYAELLRLMGFAYGIYRISTVNGSIDVKVTPKVNVASNKKFKNATLSKAQKTGTYKMGTSSKGVKIKYKVNVVSNKKFKNATLSKGQKTGNYNEASGAGKLKNPEIGNKLDYLFGKAKGNKHNIQRSQTMQSELSKIGIYDTPSSRELLNNHLKNVVNDSSNILKTESRSYIAKELPGTPTVNYTATVRESFLKGPNGGVKIESVWDGDTLLTIIVKGGK